MPFVDDDTPDNHTAFTPSAVFEVARGSRYRFRVISPGFTLCPIRVSVEDHQLSMISSDGAPFKPLQVDSFIVFPGERSV